MNIVNIMTPLQFAMPACEGNTLVILSSWFPSTTTLDKDSMILHSKATKQKQKLHNIDLISLILLKNILFGYLHNLPPTTEI